MVGDVARHTQEKTFPQEHQLPVEGSGRGIAKCSQHVALTAGVQTWHHNLDTDHDDNLEHAMHAHSFWVSASDHTQSVRSHTHFFSHPCFHPGTSQRNHFRQNNMEDNMCAWCATCASHSTHELVGEQTLNFFLCIVILNYFLNKTKYDSKISATLNVYVGPAIGNLFFL